MDIGNWIEKGGRYFLEIQIDSNISEDDRKLIEGKILQSLVRGTDLVRGAKVNKLYRYNLESAAVIQEVLNQFKSALKTSVADIVEEIIPHDYTDHGIIHVET